MGSQVKPKNKKIYGWINTLYHGEVDEYDIYKTVKKHSRLIDRLDPRKMYMMTAFMRDAYNIDDPEWQRLFTDDKWTFYGKGNKPKYF
jgi:hypothetical protein